MTSFGEHVKGTEQVTLCFCKKIEAFDNSSAMSEKEI